MPRSMLAIGSPVNYRSRPVTCLLVALYVLGGALELTGLAIVVVDLKQAYDRATKVAERPVEHYYSGARITRPGRPPDPKVISRQVRTTRANQEHAIKEARADLIHVLAGNIGRRVVGLIALALGLALGIAGNVLSLYQ